MTPDDAVYVYGPAGMALDYYKVGGGNFLYGKYHHDDPHQYLEEISGLITPGFDRLWLVFSNTYNDDEQRIVMHMAAQWGLTKVVDAIGAALYFGVRRPLSDG